MRHIGTVNWKALSDIAKRVGMTEAETAVVLDRLIVQRRVDRKLATIKGRASTWYRATA